MNVALWDEPSTTLFAEGIASTGGAVLHKMGRRDSRQALIRGDVDLAFLPTLTLFRDHELLDPLPVATLSSWDFPPVQLSLNQSMDAAVETLICDPRYAQEILVAQIILKEQYNVRPAVKPVPADQLDAAAEEPQSATLWVNRPPSEDLVDAIILDLGREWFELTNYPMVWGLFAVRKGEGTTDQIRWLRGMVQAAEELRASLLEERGDDPLVGETIRLRLDDLATASLTTLHDFLYYYEVVEELKPLSFVMAGLEADDDDDDQQPLL